MTEEPESLTPQTVAGIGELRWDEPLGAWTGNTEFGGNVVRIALLCDLKSPTREDKLAVLGSADKAPELLKGLRCVEPELRRRAVEGIIEAVCQQISEEEAQEATNQMEGFAESLELEKIWLIETDTRELHGDLDYRVVRGTAFVDYTITVAFDEDLLYEEVQVVEPARPK